MSQCECDPMGETVVRPCMVFRFGQYPSKRWGLTREEFLIANDDYATKELPIGLDPVGRDHYVGMDSVLDGHTGVVTDLEIRGDELWGQARLPRLVYLAAKKAQLGLSGVFIGPGYNILSKVDLVKNAHVRGASIRFDDGPAIPRGTKIIDWLEDQVASLRADFDRDRSPKAVALSSSGASTMAVETDREARRKANHAYIEAQQSRGSETPTEAPAARPLVFQGVDGVRATPSRNLDDPDVVAMARAALGDRFEDRLRADIDRLKPYVSRFQSDEPEAGFRFDGLAARFRQQSATVLRAVAAGLPIDDPGIVEESAADLMRSWFSVAPGNRLLLLLGSAQNFSMWAKTRLDQLGKELGQGSFELRQGMGIDEFGARYGAAVAARSEVNRKVALVEKSLAGLKPEVARRVREAVEDFGSRDDLLNQAREALMYAARWPGEDRELKALEARLLEAAEKMNRFRSTDPDVVEGPLAAQARSERDAVLELTEARRVEVERLAVDRLGRTIDDALAGDFAAFGEIQSLVAEVPSAFPAGLGDSLRPIPLEAVLAAGPVGFAHGL